MVSKIKGYGKWRSLQAMPFLYAQSYAAFGKDICEICENLIERKEELGYNLSMEEVA